MEEVRPFRLGPGPTLKILDQTLLPETETWLEVEELETLCEAIRSLRVRGAPLLGTMGALGMAIAASSGMTTASQLALAGTALKATRPTAVDLEWAVDRAIAVAKDLSPTSRPAALWEHAMAIVELRDRQDRAIAELGAPLISGTVLTHCNAGALATGGIGTALGIVRVAWERGQVERCYCTETRPLLQGARLTTWELTKIGIPTTLLPDTAAGALMASGAVGAVITGADRIAANGDSANKVGTLQLALAAARHGVPFYIAAPTSTIDRNSPDGASIPIEHRAPEEVGGFANERWAPEGIEAYNPAFDITPVDLITAIITEYVVHKDPSRGGIASS